MATTIRNTKTLAMPDIINPPDGYVVTFSGADGYYIPKPLSRILSISTPNTSPYTPINEDAVLVQDHVGTLTVNLPLGQTVGKVFFIKDAAGVAATKNIVVSGNGNNIDGSPTQTINTNFSCLELIFTGASWAILAKF